MAAPLKLLPPMRIERQTTGATLLCLQRRDVPLVSAQLVCAGGRLYESIAAAGVSELAAALISQGPEGYEPLAWHRRLDALGISIDIRAQEDAWAAGFECLSSDLPQALDLFAELLTRPGLHRSEWRRLISERVAAARENWAQPGYVLRALASVHALGYGHPNATVPSARALSRLRYADAARIAAGAFCGDGEVYALIAGDIAEAAGIAALERLLAALPRRQQPVPAEPAPAPASRRVWLMDNHRSTQAFFALTRPGVRAGDPQRVPLRLANYIIGGGMTSRLMRRVREETGRTYSVAAVLPESRLAQPFAIHSFTRLDNLADMLRLIERVLLDTAEHGVTSEELAEAGRHCHGALPLSLEAPYAILAYVAAGMRAGLSAEALEADWQAYRSNSPDAVNAAARRLLGDCSFRLAVIGPARQLLPQLEASGAVAVFPFRTPPERWPRQAG